MPKIVLLAPSALRNPPFEIWGVAALNVGNPRFIVSELRALLQLKAAGQQVVPAVVVRADSCGANVQSRTFRTWL